jgi:tetratricopeptide (TPR) repeat protein
MGVRRLVLIAILLAAIGAAQQPETLSLLGRPLFPPSIDSDRKQQLEADLTTARAAYNAKPDADGALHLARISTALGRLGDAIEIYTRAIEAYPTDGRLYADRGRVFITLRKFDLAERDLSRAMQPVEGKPAAIDPDLQYDLGLARYFEAQFSAAADAFRGSLKTAKSPDRIAAASLWLYVSLQRLHKRDEANQIVQQVPAAADPDDPYVRLLQFYKGALPESPLEAKGPNGVMLAYGIAVRGLWTGAVEEARTSFKRIVEKDEKLWTAPGYIAAEAELARLSKAERKKLKWK